jgi:hypothetical protein
MDNEHKKIWKDHLLKSSLPLEYDVLKYLEQKGAIADFEYSYLKADENKTIKEFSYDIDASYIFPPHYVDLMIECKYRHQSTNWVFIPEDYGGPYEVYQNSFLHASDHFTKKLKFLYDGSFPFEYAPLCSRGIEIGSTGDNSKTIIQASTQLAYAFAGKMVDGMLHQADQLLGGEVIFYHIPIIITTAKLFRLRSNVSIEAIEHSDSIEQVADQHDSLVLKYRTGLDLRNHSQHVFERFKESYGVAKLQEKLHSYNDDLDFVFSVIANTYCPRSILVLHHSGDNKSLSKLFDYIESVLKPSQEILDGVNKHKESMNQMALNLETKINNKTTGRLTSGSS